MAKKKVGSLWIVFGIVLAIIVSAAWNLWLSSDSILSVVIQTLVYFMRPHAQLPNDILTGAGIWTRRDLETNEELWRVELSQENVEDLKKMVAHATSVNIEIKQLRKEHCPLGSVSELIPVWRNATTPGDGIGFIVIRGFPIDSWTESEAGVAFWCVGKYLGHAGAQNGKGDIMGHVRNEFTTKQEQERAHGTVRQYRTNEAITFHSDAADVVALYCLGQGISGGSSRVVSSGAVYNILKQRHPKLVDVLFDSMIFDTRGDGGVDYFTIHPSRFYKGVLRTFLHLEYMQTAYQHKSAPSGGLPMKHKELIDAYGAIADEIALNMDFRKGDLQLVSNHIVLHARTAFRDMGHGDATNTRHLLRMWLSTGASIGFNDGAVDITALYLSAHELLVMLSNLVKLKAIKAVYGQ